jgi:hypothetical protein
VSGIKVTRIATTGQELAGGRSLDAVYMGDDVDATTGLPLDGLIDVDAPAPDDNDVLTWDDGTGTWIAAPAGGTGLDVALVTVAATGATETVDVSVARTYDLTLTADCTLTLTGAVAGEAWFVTLLLRQDGTGGWDVTWPGSVEWATGGAPTIDPAVNALTVVTLGSVDGGTVWLGFPTGGAGGASALDDLTDVDAAAPADQDVLTWDDGAGEWIAQAPTGGGLTVADEGTPLSTAATTLDFVGAGVVASGTGATKTITIAASGGTGGISYPLDDYLASSGSGRNDEFDGGPGLDGKWTLVGTTPDDVDINNDYADMAYLRRNDTSGELSAYYQDLPTLPCDIFLSAAADNAGANYARGIGLVLLPASPTTSSRGYYLGSNYNGSRITAGIKYNGLSSYDGQPHTGAGSGLAAWYRITILSGGTTIDVYYSLNGYLWHQLDSAYSLPFTVANAGFALAPEGQSVDLEAIVKAYRVSA